MLFIQPSGASLRKVLCKCRSDYYYYPPAPAGVHGGGDGKLAPQHVCAQGFGFGSRRGSQWPDLLHPPRSWRRQIPCRPQDRYGVSLGSKHRGALEVSWVFELATPSVLCSCSDRFSPDESQKHSVVFSPSVFRTRWSRVFSVMDGLIVTANKTYSISVCYGHITVVLKETWSYPVHNLTFILEPSRSPLLNLWLEIVRQHVK